MSYWMRLFAQPHDYTALSQLLSAIRPESVTAAELADQDGYLPPGSLLHRVVADRGDGSLLGYAEAYRYTNTAEGKFYVDVAVHPEGRGPGAGAALLASAHAFATSYGATKLVASLAETDEVSLAFARRRGYEIVRLGYDSFLDLTAFDATPFAGLLDQVRFGGIRLFTLAEATGPETEQRLYELYRLTFPDIPGYEAKSFMPLATWRRLAIEAKGCRPDWVFIAADGQRLVGATTMVEREGHVYTNHTLVDPAYRGRKLALALKLLAIEGARAAGATLAKTGNDSLNEPMLRVNRKLGYEARRGSYEVVKYVGVS